jgi:hypothetical protein
MTAMTFRTARIPLLGIARWSTWQFSIQVDNPTMELSPQSAQEVQKLLNGLPIRSGDLIVGALDATAKKTLSILVTHSSVLLPVKGVSQADEFRRLFKAEQTVEPEISPTATPTAVIRPQRNWRLEKLTCKSVRGIAPPGEQFEFNFGSKSLLIFGPNGSGKSSLASAVIWALTGNMPTDSENPLPTATLYRLADSSKACEWEVIRTLPNTILEATSGNDDCFAQVELRDGAGNAIHFRRELIAGLTSSIDLLTWQPCKSLEDFGISALDLQLSLTAPSTFGRKSIESAEDI